MKKIQKENLLTTTTKRMKKQIIMKTTWENTDIWGLTPSWRPSLEHFPRSRPPRQPTKRRPSQGQTRRRPLFLSKKTFLKTDSISVEHRPSTWSLPDRVNCFLFLTWSRFSLSDPVLPIYSHSHIEYTLFRSFDIWTCHRQTRTAS